MNKAYLKRLWGKIWYFLWEDDSFLSWAVNVVVAFILIKWVIYPGLGLILDTSHPVVAVISSSMEHDNEFDAWWNSQGRWYVDHNISKQDFEGYIFENGFDKGEIIVLRGAEPAEIDVGDVIVFKTKAKPEPIIHRIVKINELDGYYFFQTKGDHNPDSFHFEFNIKQEQVIGSAIFKIPFLGYIKIWFVDLLRFLHIIT